METMEFECSKCGCGLFFEIINNRIKIEPCYNCNDRILKIMKHLESAVDKYRKDNESV